MTLAGYDWRRDTSSTCGGCGRGVFRTSHSLLHRDDTPICVLDALPRAVQRVARRVVGRPS